MYSSHMIGYVGFSFSLNMLNIVLFAQNSNVIVNNSDSILCVFSQSLYNTPIYLFAQIFNVFSNTYHSTYPSIHSTSNEKITSITYI